MLEAASNYPESHARPRQLCPQTLTCALDGEVSNPPDRVVFIFSEKKKKHRPLLSPPHRRTASLLAHFRPGQTSGLQISSPAPRRLTLMASSSDEQPKPPEPPAATAVVAAAAAVPPQTHAEWAASLQAYYAAAGHHPYAWPA